MRTRQEIFDIVAVHLIQQGVRSYDAGLDLCLYRGPGGTKCAAGALLPDDIDLGDRNGAGFDGLPRYIREAAGVADVDIYFVRALQIIHDQSSAPATWTGRLASLAFDHGLSTAALDAAVAAKAAP